MICIHCRGELGNTHKFCGCCGAAVPRAEELSSELPPPSAPTLDKDTLDRLRTGAVVCGVLALWQLIASIFVLQAAASAASAVFAAWCGVVAWWAWARPGVASALVVGVTLALKSLVTFGLMIATSSPGDVHQSSAIYFEPCIYGMTSYYMLKTVLEMRRARHASAGMISAQ
jgi:hypothetical protein